MLIGCSEFSNDSLWRFIMTTYHFIGIKGTGMSALAQILHDSGEKVQGSDVDKVFFTQEELEKKGIPIYSFSEDNIKKEDIIIAGKDRKSTRLNSSHVAISYAVFCLKKKKKIVIYI